MREQKQDEKNAKSRRIRWASIQSLWERWGIQSRLQLENLKRWGYLRDLRNIKMDLAEVGCGGMDWIHMAQDKI
jgi:hypothetical protein